MGTVEQREHRYDDRCTGWAITLAWPATWCKRAGAWYDGAMRMIGVTRDGYYQVGHAAVLLLPDGEAIAHYFDMGRYHAPGGTARVRSAFTDHELAVNSRPVRDGAGELPSNLAAILAEIAGNKACHGSGPMHWAAVPLKCDHAFQKAMVMQQQDFHTYGPFAPGGSNCSRFVRTVLLAGDPPPRARRALLFPWTLSPTPMTNVQACSTVGPCGVITSEEDAVAQASLA
jgi:hypothetical protein